MVFNFRDVAPDRATTCHNMRPHVTVAQQQHAKFGRYEFVVKELPALVEAR